MIEALARPNRGGNLASRTARIPTILLALISISFNTSCNFEVPKTVTPAALSTTLLNSELETTTLKKVIAQHKGQSMVLNFWASWCRDCIENIGVYNEMQRKYPGTKFINLSADRTTERWQQNINHYSINGEHYFLEQGLTGPADDFFNIDWIPRYVLLDATGNIKIFKAIKPTDINLQKALE